MFPYCVCVYVCVHVRACARLFVCADGIRGLCICLNPARFPISHAHTPPLKLPLMLLHVLRSL